MDSQEKPNLWTIVGGLALAVAVVAPIWAFFNVRVEFPPMVGDDHAMTTVDSPVPINLVANDADPDGHLDCSRVTIVESPAFGYVTVDPQSGVCTYAPVRGFAGPDKFSYQIHDDEGVISNIGFVNIRVEPQPTRGDL
jgi:large repetitive protein